MKIVVYHAGELFGRMFRALERSIAANCPHAQVVEIVGDGVHRLAGVSAHVEQNTIKLDAWAKAAHEHAGDDVLLLDADTMVLGDLSEAFGDFDIGVTFRDYKVAFNAGAIYLPAGRNGRWFVEAWSHLNADAASCKHTRHIEFPKFGGANQYALAQMLARPHGFAVGQLDCATWNSVDQTWDQFSDSTRVVHLKGRLRASALSAAPPESHTLAHLWKTFDVPVEVVEAA